MELNTKAKKKMELVKDHGWQVLDSSDCGLTGIPGEIYDFKDLIALQFDNLIPGDEKIKNKIRTISPNISNLQNLITLSISGNRIKTLPNEIAQLRKLTTSDLTNDPLIELNNETAGMTSLKNLLLKDNPLQFLPPEIAERGIKAIRTFFQRTI